MWNLTSERAKHERKLAEAYLMWWTIFFSDYNHEWEYHGITTIIIIKFVSVDNLFMTDVCVCILCIYYQALFN